ncbi:MAG: glutamate--tRNA ligase [Halobacteriaceae archaeon]
MDDALRTRVREAAETAALENALRHDGDAQVQAIVGPLLADNPAFRDHADEIADVVAPIVADVNSMDRDAQRDRLASLAPDRLADIDADQDEAATGLPALPAVEDYDQVRMRMAPNPNGPWHLGNARMCAVVGRYKERYDGWFVCRFDDTDPETKRPDLDAYDWILEDIDYLGFEPDAVLYASDRLDTYYEYARDLIDLGGAYTCTCAAERFRELKNAGEPCPHRDKDPATVHEEFDRMVAGDPDPGEMVVRVKTDIDHDDPALRDWVAFRMLDTPHPRPAASEYRCWPMLDFQSGIDDHLTGITHIIRGIDLQDSAKKQAYVYDYFGWEYPEVLHWGRIQVDAYDVPMSTSTIKELIAAGDLDGWDDPRAPTVRSLRRRGIRGDAIVEAMVDLGLSTSDVDLAMSSIYANNRELVDDDADRCFFVRDGVAKQVIGGPDAGTPPIHPDHEERGTRTIPVTGSVLVEPGDVPASGDRIWLKGFGPVKHTRDAFEYTGEDLSIVRDGDVPVVHWVPADAGVPVTVRTMDGDVDGLAEPGFADYDSDAFLQFERVGFVRVDRPVTDDADGIAYYAHP